MSGWIERLRKFVQEEMWRGTAWWVRFLQLCWVIGEGFVRDQLLLRAHSLTYLTMLSIVPLLAIAVSFAGLLGLSDRVLELIVTQLTATVPEAGEWLMRWTERLDFGALGPVAGAVLIATTVLAIGGIEKALNAIWGVTKQRPWVRRVPDYLAVLVIAPLLLGVAIPLRASLESQWVVQRLLELPYFSDLYAAGLRHAPLLLVIAAFSFLYWFLPNTEVRARSALLGGLVAGLLFGLVQSAYLVLNVGAARYNAIFGSFAALPLFMVWVYMSWSVILLGAEVAYAHQTLDRYRREVRGTPPGPAARESIGLAIALQVARVFTAGAAPWSSQGLSDALDVPLRTVRDVIAELEKAGIVRGCADDVADDTWQLARPPERVQVEDVLEALRGPREASMRPSEISAAVHRVLADVDASTMQAAAAVDLRGLIARLPAGADRAVEAR